MKRNPPHLITAAADNARCEGADGLGIIPKLIGLLLLLAIVIFATLGNLPRLIVETHDDHSTADSFQVSEHHEDIHHEDHLPTDDHEDGEHSHHHHHVEISPSLIIAVEALTDTKIFRAISALSVIFPDEICPPSPFSEIVKPPQVA